MVICPLLCDQLSMYLRASPSALWREGGAAVVKCRIPLRGVTVYLTCLFRSFLTQPPPMGPHLSRWGKPGGRGKSEFWTEVSRGRDGALDTCVQLPPCRGPMSSPQGARRRAVGPLPRACVICDPTRHGWKWALCRCPVTRADQRAGGPGATVALSRH